MSFVLIVDDSVPAAEAIAGMVQLLGWQVEIAPGPRAAMLAIQRIQPKLVLLDVNMQGVSGIEVLKYIKRDPVYGNIPVVLVSAEDDPEIQQKGRDAGALEYLVKPVEIEMLEAVFARIQN